MSRKACPLMAVLVMAACGSDFSPVVRQIQPGLLAIDTAPGVTLEVLDWGGSGDALVFLAGGGHTAREFDEFAPMLTDTFRPIGITRRGIGGSSDASYATERDRLRDIERVLDALEIKSAVFVGHSQGGLEAAQFAHAHPDRCRGIIHLDSGYLGGEAELAEILRMTPPPPAPQMSSADSSSSAAVRAWVERTEGHLIPESEIRATHRVDPMGRILERDRRSVGVRSKVVGKVRQPQWAEVGCPSLGMYAVPAPLETWLPHYSARFESLGVEERARADAYVQAFSHWTAARREEFARSPGNEIVEFPGGGHYFFLRKSEQGRTLQVIREFLARLE